MPTMSNKTYNTLKWFAQIILPALATFYYAIAQVWLLPYSHEIVGTISALDLLIGTVIGISSAKYPGEGVITFDPNTGDANLDLSTDMFSGEKMVMVKLVEHKGENS